MDEATRRKIAKVRIGEAGQIERNWKHDIIRPAIAHPKGSADRKAAVDRLAGTVRLDWRGKRVRLARSTVYSWIRVFETDGVHYLAHKMRSDRGRKRGFISREWTARTVR